MGSESRRVLSRNKTQHVIPLIPRAFWPLAAATPQVGASRPASDRGRGRLTTRRGRAILTGVEIALPLARISTRTLGGSNSNKPVPVPAIWTEKNRVASFSVPAASVQSMPVGGPVDTAQERLRADAYESFTAVEQRAVDARKTTIAKVEAEQSHSTLRPPHGWNSGRT